MVMVMLFLGYLRKILLGKVESSLFLLRDSLVVLGDEAVIKIIKVFFSGWWVFGGNYNQSQKCKYCEFHF